MGLADLARSIAYDPRIFLGPVLAPRGGPEVLFPCILRGEGGRKGAWPKEGVAKRGRGQSGIFSIAYIRELY